MELSLRSMEILSWVVASWGGIKEGNFDLRAPETAAMAFAVLDAFIVFYEEGGIRSRKEQERDSHLGN